MENELFDWVEFKGKPNKEGVHESGYKYIKVIGVRDKRRKVIAEFADNITISKDILRRTQNEMEFFSVAIDITKSGVQRLFARDGMLMQNGFAGSDIRFFVVKRPYVKR